MDNGNKRQPQSKLQQMLAKKRGSATMLTPPAPTPVKAPLAPVSGAVAREPIAVIGMGCRFPKSPDAFTFWDNLVNNIEMLTPLKESRWSDIADSLSVSKLGFIDDATGFDARFFQMSPREAEATDPHQRVFMEVVWETVEDAGYDPQSLSGSDTGVFVAVYNDDFALCKPGDGEADPLDAPGTLHAAVANRVSFSLDLQGPSEVFNTACSSGLVALNRAVAALRAGECDVALTGGVSLLLLPRRIFALGALGMFSKQGVCRPFDADADGQMIGEGAGAILLKPLSAAVRDGDNIYAQILGGAVNHQGALSGSLTMPNANAQTKLAAKACKAAGITPDTLSYIEGHGSGGYGDQVEFFAFSRYMEKEGLTDTSDRIGLGSVKSNIGFLEAAGAISQIIKVVLSLKHQTLPATINHTRTPGELEIEKTPFYIVSKNRTWTPLTDGSGAPIPRRAGVNAYGLTGTNAHIIFEEYNQSAVSSVAPGPQMIPLSAMTRDILRDLAGRLAGRLRALGSQAPGLGDIAFTLQTGRRHHGERVVVSVGSIDELLTRLDQIASGVFDGPDMWQGSIQSREKKGAVDYADPAAVAVAWTTGIKTDWSQLQQAGNPRRVSLPGYPFAHTNFPIPSGGSVLPATDDDDWEEYEAAVEQPVVVEGDDRLAADIAAIAAKILRCPISDIDFAANMSVYGMNSMMLGEFSNEMGKAYDVTITPDVFFEHQSLGSFINYVRTSFPEKFGGDAPTPAAVAAPRERKRRKGGSKGREQIAVVGMSGRLPGSRNLDEFWSHISSGDFMITKIPEDRWDWRAYDGDPIKEPGTTNIHFGGFMPDMESFDNLFFGISPREAKAMDPHQRVMIEVVWSAIENAGYKPSDLAGTRTGVFIGGGSLDWAAMTSSANPDAYATTGTSFSLLSNRISFLFNFSGPSEPVDTACSSSLVAVHRAIQAIQAGDADLGIAGGVNLLLSPLAYVALTRTGVLASDGRCKTFDSTANGYVRGEGAGAVFLKPLSRAVADGDYIHAVIKGSAVNHGGQANSLTAPNPNAQANLLLDAYRSANVDPSTIAFIEAHGTGTALGDPVEINGLKKAFGTLYQDWGKQAPEQAHCGLGSVKTNIGHLEPAAGIAGLFKLILAMRHRRLPKTLHLNQVNDLIKLEGSPFYILHDAAQWPVFHDDDGVELPRRAGISSFGYGGSNSHVVLESHDAPSQHKSTPGPRLLLLSARNKNALQRQAEELDVFLSNSVAGVGSEDELLERTAYTLQVGRESHVERLAVLADTVAEARERLQRFVKDGAASDNIYYANTKKSDQGMDLLLAGDTGADFLKAMAAKKEFGKLAKLWVSGGDVLWRALYDDPKPGRLPLPAYPFEIHPFKLPSPITAAPSRVKAAPSATNLELKFYKTGWEPEALGGPDKKGVASLLVFGCEPPQVDALAAQFPGVPLTRVFYGDSFAVLGNGVYRLNPERIEDFAALWDQLRTAPSHVVQLARAGFGPAALDHGVLFIYRFFNSMTTKNINPPRRYLFVCDKNANPYLEAVGGYTRSLMNAYARLEFLTLGLPDGLAPVTVAGLLADEIRAAKSRQGFEFRYENGTRLTRRFQHLTAPLSGSPPIREGGVYLITGGTGALGLAFSRHLVEKYNAKLALIGRSPLSEKRSQAIAELAKLGGKIAYFQADMGDARALGRAVDEARAALGPINGVLHMAGINTGPPIGKKPYQQFREILAPKIEGTLALDQCTNNDPLDWFVLFSSTSSYLGDMGQGDYPTGNRFLDAFVNTRNARGGKGLTLSINWPLWREGGMHLDNDKMEEMYIKSTGMHLLKTQTGIQAMEDLLASGATAAMVLYGNAAQFERGLGLGTPAQPATRTAPATPAAPVKAAGPAAAPAPVASSSGASAKHALVRDLVEMSARLLEQDASKIDPAQNLGDYGFDSISFKELADAIGAKYGVELFPTVFFSHPEIDGLADHLLAEHGSVASAYAAPAAAPATPAAPAPTSTIEVTPMLQTPAPSAPAPRLIEDLQKLAADLLDMSPSSIDPDENIGNYGFDSISLRELAEVINDKYGVELTPDRFFEYDTLSALEGFLIEEGGEALLAQVPAPAAPAAPAPVQNAPTYTAPSVQPPVVPAPVVGPQYGGSVAREDIAIVGMSGVMPQSDNLDAFWEHLAAGRDLISEIPSDRWDWRLFDGDPLRDVNKTNVHFGGFLNSVDQFDSAFFDIVPFEAAAMDPSHKMLMEIVWNTIEDAGYAAADLAGTKTGLFIGTCSSDFSVVAVDSGVPVEAHTGTSLSLSMLPNRISFYLDLRGPSEPVDTACSSSVVALHRAVCSIHNGDADGAIAGGVNLLLRPITYIALSKAGMLAPDGRCKTFDSRANGYARGEGAGAIYIKPLSRAQADGDHIYALIKGTAINHGGRATSLTAPNPNAQAELLIDAYAKAGIDPASLTYLEAHGTGTPLGDPIEINALKKAFKHIYQSWGKTAEANTCGLGSVKTNTGHLEGAAGMASLFKVLLGMKHETIPATCNLIEVNPMVKLEGSPFYLVRETRPWLLPKDAYGNSLPRRAGISSFGFGGVNCHIVLEQPIPVQTTPQSDNHQRLFILSGKTPAALERRARQILAWMDKQEQQPAACQSDAELADKLVGYVAELLNLNPGDVAVDDDFEEMGLDLVQMSGLANRLDREHGVFHTPAELLSHHNLETLAAFLSDAIPPEISPGGGIDLDRLTYTLQVGREPMIERLATTVRSVTELREKLNRFLSGDQEIPAFFAGNAKKTKGKFDLILSGRSGETYLRAVIADREFEKLARLWVAAVDIDWNLVYTNGKPQRLSLPTYPFEKIAYPVAPARALDGSARLQPMTAPAAPVAAAKAAQPVSRGGKTRALVLKRVAELTGAAQNTLSDDTHLEADLALDSIKMLTLANRLIDIIPADKAANLADHVSEFETLGDIIDYASEDEPEEAVVAANPMRDRIMAKIAELTGVAEAELNEDTHLEADLALDSIKMLTLANRLVDILPEEKAASLAGQVAEFETLGDILDYALEGQADVSPQPAPAATNAMRSQLIAKVSELTGVAQDELSDDTHLEADLALDSIKMLTLANRIAGLIPADKAADLADHVSEFETLGDIFAFAGDGDSGTDSAAPAEVALAQPSQVLRYADAQPIEILHGQYTQMVGHFLVDSNSLCSAVRLRGAFDTALARRIWGRLIDRHINLRAVFRVPEGAANFSDYSYELVADPQPPQIEMVDIRHLSAGEKETRAQEIFDGFLAHNWKMDQWPMHLFSALRLEDDLYQLYLANEHIISDGLGNQQLLREFLELYESETTGKPDNLPAAPSDQAYRDGVRLMNDWKPSPEEQAAFDDYVAKQGRAAFFWDPAGRDRPNWVPAFKNMVFHFGKELTAQLTQRTREARIPLNSLLASAYLKALAAFDIKSKVFIIQLPTAGTIYPGLELDHAVASFAQNLSLSFDRPAADESWVDLINRVHKTIQHALTWGFDRVQSVSQTDLVRTGMPLENGRVPGMMLPILNANMKSNIYFPYTGQTRMRESYGDLELVDYRAGTINIPGAVDVLQEIHRDELHAFCNFDSKFFDTETMVALIERYRTHLDEIAATSFAQETEIVEESAEPAAGYSYADMQAVISAAEDVLHLGIGEDEIELDLEADLGVDSLERVRLVTHLYKDCGGKADRMALYEGRTIAEIATIVLEAQGAPKSAAAPAAAPVAVTQPAADHGPKSDPFDVDLAPIPYLYFINQAKLRPDAVAVTGGGEQITYRQLDERSNQLAHFLRDQGVEPGGFVGIMTYRGPRMLIGMMGILKAGAAYVPVDPDYPAARIKYILDHAKVRQLIAEKAVDHRVDECVSTDDQVNTLIFLDEKVTGLPLKEMGITQVLDAADLNSQPTQPVENKSQPRDLMVVLYTSGSTGRPKGVALHHEGYVNRIKWHHEFFGLEPGERVVQKTSCCFDISVWELFWPLMVGGVVCAVDKDTLKNPWAMAEWVKQNRINVMHFVPSMFGEFIRALAGEKWEFPDLRDLVFSGEALPVPFIREWIDAHGMRVGLTNLYGPTEASIDVTFHKVPKRPDDEVVRIPIGAPIDGCTILIRDPKTGKRLPQGEQGELCIGGIQLAVGYLKDPEKTAKAFIDNPFDDIEGDKIYRTGDLCIELPNGEFDYRGRIDSQIKIRGFRVELGEIESVLNEHDAVDEAAVLAIDFGDRKKLIAWISGREVAAREIKEFVGKRLTDYMIPSQVIHRDGLPKNNNGKLDRKILLGEFNSKKPGGAAPKPAAVAPKPAHQVFPDGLAPIPYMHFIEQAKMLPDAVAVTGGGEQVTYRELDERSNQVAQFLRSQGVEPGGFVGVMTFRGPRMLIAIMGILKAGAAYVPVDPDYPAARIKYILEHAQVRQLIAEKAVGDRIDECVDGQGSVDTLIFLDERVAELSAKMSQVLDASDLDKQPKAPVENRSKPSDLMVVLYTSGSTGRPKGVALNHEGYVNRIKWHHDFFGLRVGERVVQKTSCCFDISVWELFWPLMVGGVVCAVDKDTLKNPWAMAEWVKTNRINVMHFVPSMFGEFIRALSGEKWEFPDLRDLIFSGEALPVPFIREWIDTHGTRIGLTNLYGPTEASIDVTYHKVPERPADEVVRIPIGAPIDGCAILIRDPKTGKRLPQGEQGELCIGGIQLATCYLKDPEKTAKAFIENPFDDVEGDRIYRTGDLCIELPNGEFDYRGRIDSQIKIRGFRVELGEIESVLNEHDTVDEAAVLAIDFGDRKKLIAWVSGRPAPQREIKEFVGKRLTDYMIPSQVIQRDGLPKNNNGKLDRKVLMSEFNAGREKGKTASSTTPSTDSDDAPAASGPLVLPLAPAQRWLVQHFAPTHRWFGLNRLTLKTGFDPDLAVAAFQALSERHAALRTSFHQEDGAWTQHIHANPDNGLAVESIDLSRLSPAKRDQRIQAKVMEYAESTRLDRMPLNRLLLGKLGRNKYEIVTFTHHIVCDMIGGFTIFDELFTIYQALARGEKPALEPVVGFDEYVQYLAKMDAAGEMDSHLEYWRTQFPQPPKLVIQPDMPDGENIESSNRTQSFKLTKTDSNKLLRHAKKHFGTTLHMVLLAPLYRMLAAGGDDRVVVSHKMNGRQLGEGKPAFLSTVGNFAVNLPLSLDAGDGDWTAWVNRIQNGFDQLPLGGITYDWLADRLPDHLYPDDRLTSVRANYLGNLTQSENPLMEPHPEQYGVRWAEPTARRTCEVEFFFSVVEGVIHLDIGFSNNRLKNESIQKLGRAYLDGLRDLVKGLPIKRGRRK